MAIGLPEGGQGELPRELQESQSISFWCYVFDADPAQVARLLRDRFGADILKQEKVSFTTMNESFGGVLTGQIKGIVQRIRRVLANGTTPNDFVDADEQAAKHKYKELKQVPENSEADEAFVPDQEMPLSEIGKMLGLTSEGICFLFNEYCQKAGVYYGEITPTMRIGVKNPCIEAMRLMLVLKQ